MPFREPAGEVVPHWISRFEIWPYLEKFTLEVEREVLAELQGRPDLIVGNYSDGNLVASLLSQRLGVTQCNIAHALEKTKYLLSDLYWRENEEQYHFSCQFTADLLAMNSADFIITSHLPGNRRHRRHGRAVRSPHGLHDAGVVPGGARDRRLRSQVQYRLAGAWIPRSTSRPATRNVA